MYDDLKGAQDVRDTIKKYPNREVENYLIDVSKQKPHVRNAMVVAPLIYGQGRGPVNQTSIQIPELCRIAIKRGRAAQIGKGRNIWSNIHVADLSSLLVELVEKAAVDDYNENLWGEKGLYFAESNAGIVNIGDRLVVLICGVYALTKINRHLNLWYSASQTPVTSRTCCRARK